MMEKLKGRRTYLLGGTLLAYIMLCAVTGTEPDQRVVDGLLSGMGWTIRLAIENAAGG